MSTQEDPYSGLPTSYLLGSVPAVVSEESKTSSYSGTETSLHAHPPSDGWRGYQTLEGSSGAETNAEHTTNNWSGMFSISSYTQYFNVDTDVVLNRLISSLSPLNGDFFSKIESNPDLYGFVWICTTLVFVIASLGNCATYLMHRRTDNNTSWSFDVSYVHSAAYSIYGYAIIVPLAFYFLLQYMGSNANIVRFWCMWGYSLCIFIVSSFLLIIPVEFLRWFIILITGAASAGFVVSNLRTYVNSSDLTVVLVAAFILQLGLAIFLKVRFFP